MRKTLTAIAVATILASFIAGCGGKTVKKKAGQGPGAAKLDIPAEGDAHYKPVVGRYGGRIILPSLGEPKSFNPITSGETSTTMFTNRIFLGLTQVNPWTFEPEPQLATEWTRDLSGLVWTVRLREGVTWSDGEPFDADDVLFTFKTIYDKRWICSTRDIVTGPNGEQWKLDKLDDHTVRFTLPDRNAVFPLLLATSIVPEHTFKPLVDAGNFNEALGPDTDPDDIVGTGAFLLAEYEPGSKIVMKRNPRFYRTDIEGNRLPYLDEIVYIITKNLDVTALKFRQKEIDLTGLRGEDYPIFKPLQGEDDFTIIRTGPANGSSFIFFNQNTGSNPETGKPFVEPHKLKWFRDTRFRQAVSHAVDRKYIVRGILNGLGYPQYGPFSLEGGAFFGNNDAPRFEYNLDKARVLLAEMGLIDRNGDGVIEDSDGNNVEFNLTTNSGNSVREKIAETIRKDLVKLGMRVNYRPMNFNILISKLDSTNDWEACVMSLTGGPEPHWGANVWRSSGRMHMWFPGQKTPSTEWEAEIDKLFAEGVRELDRDKRREIYFRWQEIVGEQQPFIYTVTPERLTAIRNRFGNVFPPRFGGFTQKVEEFFIKAD